LVKGRRQWSVNSLSTFEKENISTLDGKSELLLTILSTIAQEEARNVSENVKRGNRKLIERGTYNLPGHRYYGYKTDEQGNWVIDEEQAAVIRDIYDGYLNGNSTKSIAKELTEKGVMSPRT
jgi:site-specific DNA recombinase